MKIICFSSYTAKWYFAFKEAALAYELQKRGHEIIYVTSGNEFVRKSNLMNGTILRKQFGLKGYEISSVITDKDRKEIDLLMNKLDKNNFENLIIDGVNIGKIALFEFLIHSKKITINFTDKEWAEALIEIRNTLISFFACRAIIAKEKPDRIIAFDTLYSVNHAWENYAQLKNIPVYSLGNGLNVSDMDNTVMFIKNDWYYYVNKALRNIWPRIKQIPASKEMLHYVTDHFLGLLEAKHYIVYSAPKSKEHTDIRKFFNIKDNQKILTATMSSYDEMVAGTYIGTWKIQEKMMFATQADWIRALIDHIKERKDLFLIIRVHPREFPNKRDSVKSEHSKVLENSFKNLPDNIKINWPTDNISMYDLAQETKAFLNSWSTVGVEMSLLGIPVVLYSQELTGYPSDLNYVGKNVHDYFDKIDFAISDGWNYERMKYTYRWMALYYSRTTALLRNTKPGQKLRNETDFKQPQDINKPITLARFFYNLLPDFIKSPIRRARLNRKFEQECISQTHELVDISPIEKALLTASDTLVDVEETLKSTIDSKEEDLALRDEIKRLYNALYVGQNNEIQKDSLQYNLAQVINNSQIC